MKEMWQGIFKLQEEMGEVAQVLGKLCVYPTGKHPDGKNRRESLIEELGDLKAAIEYLEVANLTLAERGMIEERYAAKFSKFMEWGLSGVKVHE